MKNGLNLGIRGRFFLAFGVLSALTLLASIISSISYKHLSTELNQVVEGNVRTLSLMTELKERGTRLTLIAPMLLAATDSQARKQVWQELNLNIREMSGFLPEIFENTRDKQALNELAEQIEVLTETLARMDASVLSKFDIQLQKNSENQSLRWFSSNFLSEIDASIESFQGNLYRHYNQSNPDSKWGHIAYNREKTIVLNEDLQRLYRIKADVNLLISLVDRAQHLPDLNSLIATQNYSDEVAQRIEVDARAIVNQSVAQEIQKTLANIVLLAKGENSMFMLRSLERSEQQVGEDLLKQMREELARLNKLIAVQAERAQVSARGSVRNAENTIEKARFWMLLMVAASLVFSILIVWLYVGRYMVARITSLDESMRSIANGNLEQKVQIKGSDEITAMARSLIRFRDQLATLQEELVQAGKMAAMGQLSAGIAHEINQPLSAIRHYSHNGVRLLHAGRIDEVEKNLSQISALTKRATIIITRLKDMARNQPVNLIDVDVPKVIKSVLNMLEGDGGLEGACIRICYLQTDGSVQADPVQLEQVVTNLIINAFDAVKEQPVKRITVECQNRDDWLEVYVSDSGPGISDELGEQIFEPFFTTKKRGQSLGLGLAISFNIIKSFGGRLSIGKSRDSGATFCIQLPVCRSKQ